MISYLVRLCILVCIRDPCARAEAKDDTNRAIARARLLLYLNDSDFYVGTFVVLSVIILNK